MNALREKLMEEIAPLLVRCKTAKEYTMQVYSLCEKNSLQKKCRELAEKFTETGDLVKAKEFEKIYPALMDLLDQIYGLIGEDPLSLDEFIQILRRVFRRSRSERSRKCRSGCGRRYGTDPFKKIKALFSLVLTTG